MTAAPPNPNEQLVRDLFQALNPPNLEQIAALYARDADLTFSADDSIPNINLAKAPRRKERTRREAALLRGIEAILQYYEWLLFDRRRGAEFVVDNVNAVGEATVVANWHIASQDMSILDEGREVLLVGEGRIQRHTTSLSEAPSHLPLQHASEPDDAYIDPSPSASASPPDTAGEHPTPATPTASPITWPGDRCLIGMAVGVAGLPANRTGAVTPQQVYQAAFVARAEALWWPLSQPGLDVAALRRANDKLFIVACLDRRLPPAGETPAAYVQAAVPLIQPHYAAGVRYFMLQPEAEGALNIWRALFGSVGELAAWFVEVQALLKQPFPDILLGFPAIQPPYDPSWAADTARFLEEALPGLLAADWVGVACLWSTPAERDSDSGGRLYQRYRERYADKPLIITRFGSSVLGAEPLDAEALAAQVDYYHSVRSLPGLVAAFAHAPLAAGTLPNAWMSADGLPGPLAQAVGARRWGEPGDPPENFAGFATNDRPEGKDELGYDDYASAFVRVLSNPDTKTPLTIGIYGAWGMGKSFLMKRIRAMVDQQQKARDAARRKRPLARRLWETLQLLRPLRQPGATPPGRLAQIFTRPPSNQVDFRCVEFNAWVYSGSENLWAGLITHLYNDVESYLGTRRTVPFRFSQNARRAFRKIIWLLALYGLLGFLLSLLFDFNQIRAGVEALGAAAAALVVGGTLAAALAALPPLLAALRDLANSLTLARSEQLAALASRRDFRDKIGFMADIKEEIGTVRRLLDRGRQGVRTRLVIFIDDLDRCEPKKAVEVLEAIMLLLADEDGMPFVVVLGIDARIVVKAVEERYGKVLTEAGISGYEYLDKIVQIPFRIPPPPSTALANYVTSLLWRSDAERQKEEAKAAALEQARQAQAATSPGSTLAPSATAADTPASPPGTSQTPPSGTPATAPPAARDPDRAFEQFVQGAARIPQWTMPAPEVTFLPDEREAFEAYAKGEHLSPNPRRVKRILNIYRVVRLLRPNASPAERRRTIKWVVLTEQWPYRTAWLLQAAEDDAQRPAAQRTFKPADGLRAVYNLVLADIRAKDAQPFASLDADPDLFESFIDSAPAITVDHLRQLRPVTFNLNPALQGEVTKAVGRKGTRSEG